MSHETLSVWQSVTTPQHFPTLEKNIEVDVAIIGAGITGLTLANLLAKSTLKICLIERERFGHGTTGFSSAHLSTLWDPGYKTVEHKYGLDTARALYLSMRQGIDYIQKNGRNCDFKYVVGHYYAETDKQLKTVLEEKEIFEKLAIETMEMPTTLLPFSIKGGFSIGRQAIFNPMKYLNELALQLRSQNIQFYERTPALEINDNEIKTPNGNIKAQKIVFATHNPLGFTAVQATLPPYRSFIVAAPCATHFCSEDLFWDGDYPYHYIRNFKVDGQSYLMVGGEDCPVGSETEEQHFDKLKSYAQAKFGIENFPYHWSAQFYEPTDYLPLIGESITNKNQYIATGFSGDGLTLGTASALMLNEILTTGKHPWEKHFKPRKISFLNSDFAKANFNVMKHWFKDRISVDHMNPTDLRANEGCVIAKGVTSTAYYKAENNLVYEMSAVCPHMGCIVHWNNEKKSFDCPCHGSRFNQKGEVLEGPAMSDLKDRKIYSK